MNFTIETADNGWILYHEESDLAELYLCYPALQARVNELLEGVITQQITEEESTSYGEILRGLANG